MRTTVSLPSEPEPEKNTCWNCGGVTSASFSASSMAGIVAVWKKAL
jgi:hypothetical protein